jgi:serine/threonine-protein kinase
MKIDPACWPELSRLIDAMLEQPPEGREAWVRALQGTDARFVAELLSLIAPSERAVATAWLQTLPKLSDFHVEPGPDPTQLLERPGDEIGPYRLVRLLGSGGMGSVWYAERTDQLVRRAVALKLPLAVPSRVLAARFERERDILAALVHPHIARLYDAGVTADGRAYLALEYVEGQDLDRFCDTRQLGLGARVDLFLQVLRAVQYAHSRLVIHRDIKPPNILVIAEGYVRLLDFGVAKLLDDRGVEDAEITRLQGPAMTLAYAAPEQIGGHAVSTAADIYSLGVVLFELLTGVRPYRLKRDSRAALEEAILQADIPLPSAVAITAEHARARGATPARLHRELQGDLDAIVLKALQRDPAHRYVTVAAFAEDLARFRGGQAVQAHRPSRWYQVRKFVVRNRLVVGSASAAAMALLMGAGVALWQAQEAGRQARIAAAERDRALVAASHREAVEEFLSDLLLDAGRTGAPVSISLLISRADELSQREFKDNPEVRAAVLKTVGEFEGEYLGLDKALADFKQAQQLLVQTQDIGLRAGVICSRALIEGVLGHRDEAERGFRSVLDDPDIPPEALRECYDDQAQLQIFWHDGPGAARSVELALAQWERTPRHSQMQRYTLQTLEARAQTLNGHPARADAEFAQVLAGLKGLGRERGSVANLLRNDRINFAIEGGDFKSAMEQIDAAVAIQLEDVPDKPPLSLLYDRALVQSYLGRNAEALAGFADVARMARSQDPELEERALLNAAVTQAKLGQREAAEGDFQRATGRDKALAGHGASGAIAHLLVRAKLDLEEHDFAGARQRLTEALQLKGVPVAAVGSIRRLRASAELAQGDAPAALEDAREAVDADARVRGDRAYSAWVGQSQLVLGQALLAGGQRDAAWRAIDTAVEQLTQTVDRDSPPLAQSRQVLKDLARQIQLPGAPGPGATSTAVRR